MHPSEIDDNYYDVDGDKLCDKRGNLFYVNDGNRIYEVETNNSYTSDDESDEEENEFIIDMEKIINYYYMIFKKVYEILYESVKNRDD